MEVLAIVPARLGSKGIPKKNLLELGRKTLLQLAVESGLASERVTRVIVNTESELLASKGIEYGAESPFLRPAELASDTALTWSVMRHAVEELEKREGYKPDVAVILQPTTPFRTGAHIDAVVKELENPEVQSALSVREVDYSPYSMLTMGADGKMERLISAGVFITRRQDAPKVWQPNGAVYAFRSHLVKEDKFPFVGAVGVPVSLDESINIDHLWQYEFAKMMWEKRGMSKL